jgi:hypothetical protein
MGPMVLSKTTICNEKLRLIEDFMSAATDLVAAHNDQVKALVEDDRDFNRFDVLIHLAAERKWQAKYAYLIHLEKHGC